MLKTARIRILPTTALLVATFCLAGGLRAEPGGWPQFRGADGVGSVPGAKLPDEFGPDRNVRWQQEVPSGHSSPVVWGDRLFLTGHEGSKLLVLCYRRSDGELLWKRAFEMQGKEEFYHRDSNPAAPTPATDGKRVHAYFGAYGLITLDVKGELVWEQKFPVEAGQFGTGSSPILDGKKLYLLRDVGGLSALHAFDAESGKELWVTARPDARTNFSTPFLWRHAEGAELVVAGSSSLKSYDPATGKELWSVGNLTALACTSPTGSAERLYFGGWSTGNISGDKRLASAFGDDSGLTDELLSDVGKFMKHLDTNEDGSLQPEEIPPGRALDTFRYLDFNADGSWQREEVDGLLAAPMAPGENRLVAVRPGGKGDVTASHVLWSRDKGMPYVASPLLHDGRLYYVKKGGFLSSVDAVSGKPYYEAVRLGVGGEYYATPLGVGDRVLVGSVKGTMFVLGTGDEMEIIARNEFEEGIMATPAVVGDTLYLRTTKRLYAIGENKAAGKQAHNKPR